MTAPTNLWERPGALVFDWDNTLVDTWGVIHDALNTTLQAYGKPTWTPEETRTRVRKSMRDSFPGLFGERWEEAGVTFYERYEEIHTVKLEAMSGVETMLSQLQQKDLYMAVVSNKRGDYLRAEAEHLGWTGYFSQIIGANDAARDKPAPEPLQLAMSDANAREMENIWYIGDADIDMHFASRAGCLPILLRQDGPREGEFTEYPPAQHFTDCMALCKFIDNL